MTTGDSGTLATTDRELAPAVLRTFQPPDRPKLMEPNHDNSQDRSTLGSQEYRNRLLTKLNCLVAVLEVAIAKIERSLSAPGANEDRLVKIRGNLENTLAICQRAKQTLEQRLDGDPTTSSEASTATTPRPRRNRNSMSYRDYVELSSIEEYQRFKGLPPISTNDLSDTDLDDLMNQLGNL